MNITQGEWALVEGQNGHSEIRADGKCLADVWAGKILPPVDEARANARLIAAAPDMLEVLALIVNGWDHDEAVLPRDIEAARAAIKKARGDES